MTAFLMISALLAAGAPSGAAPPGSGSVPEYTRSLEERAERLVAESALRLRALDPFGLSVRPAPPGADGKDSGGEAAKTSPSAPPSPGELFRAACRALKVSLAHPGRREFVIGGRGFFTGDTFVLRHGGRVWRVAVERVGPRFAVLRERELDLTAALPLEGLFPAAPAAASSGPGAAGLPPFFEPLPPTGPVQP